VYTVAFDESGTQAAVVSALQVFRTALDGGDTSLFAVGKVYDTVNLADGKALLAKRVLRLDTRQLGIGSHIPF
jgi:methanesulfonate monooxygenase small subunit